MTLGKDDTIDKELIRDIILYKYNRMYDNSTVFDIEIRSIRMGDSGGFTSNSRYDVLVVAFDAILIGDDQAKHDKRYNDSITIDNEEYVCLLRQKKLKEIGI